MSCAFQLRLAGAFPGWALSRCIGPGCAMSRNRYKERSIMSDNETGEGLFTKARKNLVFVISIALTIALVVWCLAAGDSFVAAAGTAMGALTANFDWLYIFGMSAFVVFALVLAISPYGKTKLGASR